MSNVLRRKADPKNLQAIFECLDLFYPMSEGVKIEFDKRCFEFEMNKGEYLLRAGDYSHYVYFIMEGIVTGVATLNGKAITSFISVKGELVTAIEGLYGVCPATEDIKVEESALLIGLHVDDLDQVIRDYPEMNIIMRKVMELHYKLAHHRSVFFRIGTATDKYDFFLNAYPDHAPRIPLELTASFLNIKINTLKKIVSQQLSKNVELTKGGIEIYMEREQPFLQKKLTLLQLADQFGVRAHTMSHLLSFYFKKNFNQFVNTYRINFVLSKLENQDCLKQYSLHGLGSDAGFASNSSFFTEFKKSVGLSPQAYCKQQNEFSLMSESK
ncbi:MAG: helix-turn-helix domain-containing protein [Candidatus Pedobacter colombiensis]|uniref:Helix-turn-helix domain-containing protein n=1 Tax=Candidatus Pedobacter colombiensis TaxID=3121371 RepID=A0AAJ5W7Z4_9SPHI|nr:helix-turn-helix domain-containing protein [Pedobacter sp.]WEK19644.1 MAG: helix-turn-helix domain-containing protein [Pedobacter sp.]